MPLHRNWRLCAVSALSITAVMLVAPLEATPQSRGPTDEQIAAGLRGSPRYALLQVQTHMCTPIDSGITSIRVLRRGTPDAASLNMWPAEVEIEGRCVYAQQLTTYRQVSRFNFRPDNFGGWTPMPILGGESVTLGVSSGAAAPAPAAPAPVAAVAPAPAPAATNPTPVPVSLVADPAPLSYDTVSRNCMDRDRCLDQGAIEVQVTRLNAVQAPSVRNIEVVVRLKNVSQQRVVLGYVGGSVRVVDEDGVRYVSPEVSAEARCINSITGPSPGAPLGLAPGRTVDVVFRAQGTAGASPSSVFTVEFALAEVDVATGKPRTGPAWLFRYRDVRPPRGLGAMVDWRNTCAAGATPGR